MNFIYLFFAHSFLTGVTSDKYEYYEYFIRAIAHYAQDKK